MVCHAIGRCRICARKHKLPIFGSEENQHALMEIVKLRLIVLNTVCVDCIAKFERAVKGKETRAGYPSSACQPEVTEFRRSRNNSTAKYGQIGVRPSMHFYVESGENNPAQVSLPYENERLSPQENLNVPEETLTHRTQKAQSAEAPQKNSSPKRKNEDMEISTKVRAKSRVQCLLCCDYCEKEFTHRGDLKRHNRKHTGEKPYECTECRKKFSQLSNLSRHRLVHSGERPFACAQCGQSYSRKGRLVNHIGRELCIRNRRRPDTLIAGTEGIK